MILGGNFPLKWKNFKIKIVITHIHIPRNNPAKFQKNPINSLGRVADKGPLYMYMKEMVLGEISPPPPNEKNPKLK